jgi:hypothetical protein
LVCGEEGLSEHDMIPRQGLRKNMPQRSKPTSKEVPHFRSEQEEARWYSDHREDLQEYVDMDDGEVVDPDPLSDRGGMTQAVSVRLPQRLLSDLRRIAEQQEISHQVLIQRWLSERLLQEKTQTDTSRPQKRRTKAA